MERKLEEEENLRREILNLSRCSSTNTKYFAQEEKKSYICRLCNVSCDMCHVSYVTCQLSPTPTATATDPPIANSPTMNRTLVFKN